MKRLFFCITAALMLMPSLLSAQQNLRSGYFLDGYIYKYKMNPALSPERGFVAMPVLGSIGLGLETNLGISTFLYPTETGRLTTFLSPRVSNETFLNNISNSNKMNMNLDLGLIAFGFRTGKSYHTVDLSARMDIGTNIPGDFFKFMKIGGAMGDTSWDISNVGLRGAARLELAYGYSRSIGEALRIGARVKFLLGIIRADIAMDRMTLEMNSARWAVEAHGNMHLSAPVSLKTKGQNGNSTSASDANSIDWSGIDSSSLVEGLMNPSYGFGVDLGATYDFLDYFTASLSVLDLGVMSWKNTMTAETPVTSWMFEGFESIDDSEKLSEQLSAMTEDMMNVFNFEMTESGIKKSAALAVTINAGIEARMPFYERLSFGFLYTQRIEGVYSWSEGRISANIAPVNVLSLSTNYAFSHFGHSWGGAINLHLPGFGLFAGLDSFSPLLNVTPQYLPVNPINTNLVMGLNFTFGKYQGRFPKKK